MEQRGPRPEHEPGVDVLTSAGARAWAATAPVPSRETPAGHFELGAVQPTRAELGTERAGQPARVRRGWLRRALRPASARTGRGRRSEVAVQAAREERIRAPLPAPGRVVVCLSATGGVGTSTITALLGQRWAQLRSPEPVVAVDAHSSSGMLARRTAGECGWTVREAAVHPQPRALMVRDGCGLDVLSGDVHRGRAAVTGEKLHRAVAALREHYALVVLDVGTACGDVRGAALAEAHAVVLGAGPARDQAPPALDLVDQLHGQYGHPPGRVVISLGDGTSSPHHGELRGYLTPLSRAVVPAPRDAALATGAVICPDELSPATQGARDELAAAVTDALISNEERTP